MTRHAARLAAALLVLVACTPGDRAAAPSPSASPPASPSVTVSPSPSVTVSSSPSPSPSPGAPACPAAYAAPHADRPAVDLTFVVADDLRTVRGTERVTFTPDRPVDRLVFRLWANGPSARRGGGSLGVTRATVDGQVRPVSTGLSGTLLTIPLPRRAPAGRAIVAELAFTLRLPSGVNERWGTARGTAWFGTGFPLLAWERGRGWAEEPPTTAFAEAASSEAFRLELSVRAPAGQTVLATGVPAGRSGAAVRRRAAAVRDVLVAVGRFRVAKGSVGGTPVTVGVAPGLPDSPDTLLAAHLSGVRALAARFGPFPYESLDVAVIPVLSGGIEFPAGILLGSREDRDATLVHEIAHEWFYGLVGNNQGRDPWLDEAFATYAEALVRGTGRRYLTTPVPRVGRNRVGRPMTFWEQHRDAYYRSVYVQGGAALLRARAAAPAAFDRALRCYVNAAAHRVATPDDLRRALARLPAARRTLWQAGALPRP